MLSYSQGRSNVAPKIVLMYIIQKLNAWVVVDFRFISAFLHE